MVSSSKARDVQQEDIPHLINGTLFMHLGLALIAMTL